MQIKGKECAWQRRDCSSGFNSEIQFCRRRLTAMHREQQQIWHTG
jgi:hypothetical protein